jgi:small neutral amino acid transporter SnatA (MarC family)
MFEHRLFNDFVTPLVVIDPINVVPAFMLFTGDDPPESDGGRHYGRSFAAILVGFIITGPGSIVPVVLVTDNEQFGFAEQAQTTLVLLEVLAILYGLLLIAGSVQRFLGRTGADVLSRIAALVLAALSIDILINGIRTSFFPV